MVLCFKIVLNRNKFSIFSKEKSVWKHKNVNNQPDSYDMAKYWNKLPPQDTYLCWVPVLGGGLLFLLYQMMGAYHKWVSLFGHAVWCYPCAPVLSSTSVIAQFMSSGRLTCQNSCTCNYQHSQVVLPSAKIRRWSSISNSILLSCFKFYVTYRCAVGFWLFMCSTDRKLAHFWLKSSQQLQTVQRCD